MPKCVFQWVNESGDPTPDENDAIGEAWCESVYLVDRNSGATNVDVGTRHPICAEHAASMPGLVERGVRFTRYAPGAFGDLIETRWRFERYTKEQ